MKAIILRRPGSAENFELAELPKPSIKKGEVRIKIKAVSFNPVDYQTRKGGPEGTLVTSNILGRDLAGVIDEVAEGITGFKTGDEVMSYVCNLASSGTYTEYISVPAELVAKKPASLSFEQAAAVPVAGIAAWLALAKTKTGQAKSIFIAGGAGGVGTFALMFANHAGLKKIITTAGNDKSRNYLKQNLLLNDEQIINYKDGDFIKQALARNGGYFDITLDLVGGKMLSNCCDLLAIDGNFASVTDPPHKEDFETLFQKNASFHSIGANAYSLTDNREYWKKYQEILDEIALLFDSCELTAPPVTVVGGLSVETVKKAHELLENVVVQGKLVMVV